MKTKQKGQKSSNILTYRGYYGSIEFDSDNNCLYGTLIGLDKGAMIYEGTTPEGLKSGFEETVDAYPEHCRECNIRPEKPFSGLFSIRINPLLHQMVAIKARETGVTVNRFINKVLEREFHGSQYP